MRINKLANYYNFILDTIKNNVDEDIRYEAYQAFKSLNNDSDLDVVISNFIKEGKKNQIKILEILIAMPKSENFPFLKNVFENSEDYEIRLKSCAAIEAIGIPINLYLNSYKNMSVFNQYVKHVRDPILNF